MYADLHVHSHYSDGTDSPAILVETAKSAGVRALSLVDHDTVRGICEFINEAKKIGLEAIPGVEISTSVNGAGIHILGYHINQDSINLRKYLACLAKARTENTKLIFDRLCKMGILNYSWDYVLQHSYNKDAVYSSDVFTAMKNDNIYTSWKEFPEFYYRYFSERSEAYLDLDCYTADGAIKAILEADGIPVLAHPKLIGDDGQITKLVEKGLMGIEVYHPAHDRFDEQRYLEFAVNDDLFITGGSDWHGEMSEWDFNIGECGINQALFDRLREGELNSQERKRGM